MSKTQQKLEELNDICTSLKFKWGKGVTVKIVQRLHDHGFDIGERVTIENTGLYHIKGFKGEVPCYCCRNETGYSFIVAEHELTNEL